MSVACSMHGRVVHTRVLVERPEGKWLLGILSCRCSTILKWSLKKWDVRVWAGVVWLRIQTSGGTLVNIVMNVWFLYDAENILQWLSNCWALKKESVLWSLEDCEKMWYCKLSSIHCHSVKVRRVWGSLQDEESEASSEFYLWHSILFL